MLLLLSSCQQQSEKVDEADNNSVQKFKIENLSDDTIKIHYADGEDKFIVSKGQASECIISPDSQKIAVNTRLFSNHIITEVYHTDENGKIDIEQPMNISTIVWDSIQKKYQINPEEVLFPRTSAIKWSDDGSLIEVSIQGSTELGKKVDERIKVRINSDK